MTSPLLPTPPVVELRAGHAMVVAAGAAPPGRARAGDERLLRADGVEVVRSSRRTRTVSAYRQDGRTVVLVPARLTAAEEERWVLAMVDRLARQDARRRPGDEELQERAAILAARHLADRARPLSVRWTSRQSGRWGSCTPADASIRLSDRLQGMPSWVVDYVLVHELAHLLEPGHGPAFWALVAHYPRSERARGYLEGVAATAGLDLRED